MGKNLANYTLRIWIVVSCGQFLKRHSNDCLWCEKEIETMPLVPFMDTHIVAEVLSGDLARGRQALRLWLDHSPEAAAVWYLTSLLLQEEQDDKIELLRQRLEKRQSEEALACLAALDRMAQQNQSPAPPSPLLRMENFLHQIETYRQRLYATTPSCQEEFREIMAEVHHLAEHSGVETMDEERPEYDEHTHQVITSWIERQELEGEAVTPSVEVIGGEKEALVMALPEPEADGMDNAWSEVDAVPQAVMAGSDPEVTLGRLESFFDHIQHYRATQQQNVVLPVVTSPSEDSRLVLERLVRFQWRIHQFRHGDEMAQLEQLEFFQEKIIRRRQKNALGKLIIFADNIALYGQRQKNYSCVST